MKILLLLSLATLLSVAATAAHHKRHHIKRAKVTPKNQTPPLNLLGAKDDDTEANTVADFPSDFLRNVDDPVPIILDLLNNSLKRSHHKKRNGENETSNAENTTKSPSFLQDLVVFIKEGPWKSLQDFLGRLHNPKQPDNNEVTESFESTQASV